MRFDFVVGEGYCTRFVDGGRFATDSPGRKVALDNGHVVLARIGGKMSRHHIRIVRGDKVLLEMSPYDLRRVRIIYRRKEE